MTKQEIDKAIKNGESVWCVLLGRVEELKNLKFVGDLLRGYNKIDRFYHDITSEFFDGLYKTKAEAEHYLHHANVERVEKLPFLTWKEFLEEKEIEFTDKNKVLTWLYIVDNKTPNIQLENRFEKLKMWDLTEENFYKAYDECVRLFRGVE